MIVRSSRLGVQRVDEGDVIHFPAGVLGFEELTRYVLLSVPGSDTPIEVLQAVDDPEVGFIVVDPRTIRPDYDVVLQETDWIGLGCTGPVPKDEVLVRVILTVRERLEEMTANLLAPIVIHSGSKRGRQVIQENSPYRVRHNVLEELATGAEREGADSETSPISPRAGAPSQAMALRRRAGA